MPHLRRQRRPHTSFKSGLRAHAVTTDCILAVSSLLPNKMLLRTVSLKIHAFWLA
jgi:hypothetical protein